MSEGIGARLRGARERSRLTILQAAEKLHVDPDILEALEADNFAALGAPVYVKGHLRHYADLVGEPVEPLFELYSQGTRVPPPDLTRIPKGVPDDAGRLVAPAVIVVAVFAIAGTVWWGLSLSHRQWSSHPEPIAVQGTLPMQQAEMQQAQAQQGELAHPALVRAVASSEPPAEPMTSTVASSAPATASSMPGATSAVPRHGEIDATLTYSAASWTEVYDANGRRLVYGLSAGPATRQLEGAPPLIVMLGDARGVTLEVGGRQAAISRFVRSDHTARFLITADGRVLAPPPKKGG
jgi:cytoskeleton protein RodZ